MPAPCEENVPAGAAALDLAGLPNSLNEGQKRAVAAALHPGVPGPLIIWGPPGTGKSTLAAFIVWHLVRQPPSDIHVLVAAPSNAAADLLCGKLAKLGLGHDRLFRLNALGRSVSTVPEALLQFCRRTPEDARWAAFEVPPLDEARRFKVIVTTCICAAHLVNAARASATPGWFSHVVVDEAGEATEPETLVPASLLRPAGRLILLGDHLQLGPLVLSPLAAELAKLDYSLLERLAVERFDTASAGPDSPDLGRGEEEKEEEEEEEALAQAVQRCEARGAFFLTESYRSHPAIMALYSRMFYAGQLEHRQRAQQLELEGFFRARGLPAPLLLHHVVGEEQRDPGSASIYNMHEVAVVRQCLVDLLGDNSLQLAAKDIGLITPYVKQVQALERLVTNLGPSFEGVQCGTVETFQGQERRVIILSAVRTSGRAATAAAPGGPYRRPIGFVADPRRLNVAISRAVAGLIIVGDLHTLARHSHHWQQLLAEAQEMGCVRGDPLQGDVEAKGAAKPRHGAEASAAWDALTSEN